MIQDGRLGGAGGASIVVHRHAVEELRLLRGSEAFGPLLDEPQPQMNVTELMDAPSANEER